jgi:hypothetical protein
MTNGTNEIRVNEEQVEGNTPSTRTIALSHHDYIYTEWNGVYKAIHAIHRERQAAGVWGCACGHPACTGWSDGVEVVEFDDLVQAIYWLLG